MWGSVSTCRGGAGAELHLRLLDRGVLPTGVPRSPHCLYVTCGDYANESVTPGPQAAMEDTDAGER